MRRRSYKEAAGQGHREWQEAGRTARSERAGKLGVQVMQGLSGCGKGSEMRH